MKSRKPRKLTFGDALYRWRAHHRHGPRLASEPRRCTEVFSAFREASPTCPLRVLFPETEEHGPGSPGQRGVVVDYCAPPWQLNLNRPKVARLLIELAVKSGWVPGPVPKEFIIHDGYAFLRAHRAELDRALLTREPPEV